ncbi:MAG TPA: M1 family aminopeptidase [Vicinamibacterales bacterium]|nr:M1 family aminopeptidase [Vicinamibacterales bacterium]
MVVRLLACACLVLLPCTAAARQSAQPVEPDALTQLVFFLDRATETGDAGAIRSRVSPDVPAALVSEFVQGLTFPKPTHSAVKERDRAPLADGGGVRLLIETFTERGGEGRVASWRLDAQPGAAGAPWTIIGLERLTVVNGLFRLALDVSTEYEVRNLVVRAPDLTLTLPNGTAFVSKTPDGPTAVVLLGRGRMEFAPKQESEQGQIRIFSGSDALGADFSSVFFRVNPGEFDFRFDAASLKPRPADAGRARRAVQVFDANLSRSFQIDLNDLSTSDWSLVPSLGDVVAEVVTSRYGTLTYARSGSEPEDISFFDRRRHRNIAVYTSADKLAARGRFFSEDDRVEYDITRYDIEASFAPDRSWIEGSARLTLRARNPYFSTLTVRLADPLVVRSVTSPQFGRLLHLRVVGQNNVLIGFPSTIVSQAEIDIVITYGGRLPPQAVDREAIAVQQERIDDAIQIPVEPQYTYSNRSYWYPQAPVTDYATAKLTVNVPGDLDVVASGSQAGPAAVLPAAPGQRPRKRYVFETTKPTRYLAVLISRFQSSAPTPLMLTDDGQPLTLIVAANPRQVSKIRAHAAKAADILKFYGSLLDDAPYESFTLALTENETPGGHSPAYFALLNQPIPLSPFVWTNDPVAFPNYPSFFIAHEIAHQWWGQAVGWKNYHEQWLSEGFAQYFAALYAERERGPEQFGGVLRQMRKWAMDLSPQGPVYLGYRLGHIRSEGRTFRALVYNKGAMVLHMLRRLVGDEAFFAGLREFYSSWRYRKAGTNDFRAAMEKASGRSLEQFFDRWIFGSRLPDVQFSSRVTGRELHVRFEQKGDVFDVPITVTITYEDGRVEDVVVPVTDREVQRTIALKGPVRTVEANKDAGALADIHK